MSESSLKIEDLLGDLHGHTKMGEESGQRYGSHDSDLDALQIVEWISRGNVGIKYFTLAEHAEGFGGDHQLESFYDDPSMLALEKKKLHLLNQQNPNIKVVFGLEASIRDDGSVNLSEAVMAEAELIIASIHSGSKQDPVTLTNRALKAIESPGIDILGHMGRGNDRWEEIDWQRIGQTAARLDKAIEVSLQPTAHYSTKDHDNFEPTRHIKVLRILAQTGVKISLGTDIHHSPEIEQSSKLRFGQVRSLVELVQDLNETGFSKDQILNTYTYDQLITWAKKIKK